MTIIADKDRSAVQNLLARELVEDVELLLFAQRHVQASAPGTFDSRSCEETRELLDQLVGLSDRLHLTEYDVGTDPTAATPYNVRAVPTVIVRRRNSATPAPDAPVAAANVRFLGLPGGYEFTTLLADIVDVSQGRSDLSAEAIELVRAIDQPVHIQVFVTPSCPYCPRAARLAHQLAMQNPRIVADVIEANEFQDLSERYRVRSVPKTVINDRIEFVGSLAEAKVLKALQEAVSKHAE